ncbi:MAG: GNAT family N-acetyltransferase [Bacteroidetes bacterium]|nr:GNAT family N-acetyltransferase [Bacteroidota bacterium]
MSIINNKLDNPVWFSLAETHREFAIEHKNIKFYHPDFCPFGAFSDNEFIAEAIDKYSELVEDFYSVGEKPIFNSLIKIKKELICNQMILEKPILIEIKEEIITLNNEHVQDLFNLVNFVQPGYFKSKTSELGSYYGIYKNGRLIAVTGERMKMNSYTEVSAVVTHPEYTGKGFARQLIAHTTNKIFAQNKIPYLHVAESNVGAIKLYEKLGLNRRRKISFWNLIKEKSIKL